jgi:hypothetical protein
VTCIKIQDDARDSSHHEDDVQDVPYLEEASFGISLLLVTAFCHHIVFYHILLITNM